VPHPRPYPRCIFCSQPADSREHALPRWIAKRVSPDTNIFLETAETFGPVEMRRQPISLKNHRARILCGGCNRHFKALEDAAISILEPMIEGKRTIINVDAQRILACWGAKTAYALLAAAKPQLGDPVPQLLRDFLRKHGQPAPWVYVAYGRGDGVARITVSYLPLEDSDGNQRFAYNTVATFGQVALKVFGVVTPADEDAFGVPVGRLEQIWPTRAAIVDWPPRIPLVGESDYRDLVLFVPLLAG